jgi:hypothetical protein
LLNVHLLRWEIVWWNAPCIGRDFGLALPFQTHLTQTKPVLPMSNQHSWQVKDQGWWQCCHNKHKKFPYRPTHDVSLLSGHASCQQILVCLIFHFNVQYTRQMVQISVALIFLNLKHTSSGESWCRNQFDCFYGTRRSLIRTLWDMSQSVSSEIHINILHLSPPSGSLNKHLSAPEFSVCLLSPFTALCPASYSAFI